MEACGGDVLNLKTAVEPLRVLLLLESTNTCSCWGFHQFGALRSSRVGAVITMQLTAPKWHLLRFLG
jgi:hypothetical protein